MNVKTSIFYFLILSPKSTSWVISTVSSNIFAVAFPFKASLFLTCSLHDILHICWLAKFKTDRQIKFWQELPLPRHVFGSGVWRSLSANVLEFIKKMFRKIFIYSAANSFQQVLIVHVSRHSFAISKANVQMDSIFSSTRSNRQI